METPMPVLEFAERVGLSLRDTIRLMRSRTFSCECEPPPKWVSVLRKTDSQALSSRLAPKEEFVVRRFFGFWGDGKLDSMQNIADSAGITREYVRLCRNSALKKLHIRDFDQSQWRKFCRSKCCGSCSLYKRFFDKVKRVDDDGCWLWHKETQGLKYGNFFSGSFLPTEKTHYAHRASYLMFVEEIPEGMCVCHYCDNPICVNPNHLWLGTQRDNLRDRTIKGRNVLCGNRKFSREDILKIRQNLTTTKIELADKYDVHVQTIYKIAAGKIYKHIS